MKMCNKFTPYFYQKKSANWALNNDMVLFVGALNMIFSLNLSKIAPLEGVVQAPIFFIK